MRRLSVILLSFSFVIVACGSSDDDESSSTTEEAAPTSAAETTPPTTTPPATTAAPATTAPPATTSAPATTAAAGDPVGVSLTEFEVDTENTLAAGTTTFEVVNDGQFSHEFGVARGESYETLPLLGNGAIDEDLLGDDLLGKTAVLDPTATESIDFDLEAGTYVFFCNISVGPNSHAANGQVLSVTVS